MFCTEEIEYAGLHTSGFYLVLGILNSEIIMPKFMRERQNFAIYAKISENNHNGQWKKVFIFPYRDIMIILIFVSIRQLQFICTSPFYIQKYVIQQQGLCTYDQGKLIFSFNFRQHNELFIFSPIGFKSLNLNLAVEGKIYQCRFCN